MTQLVDDQSAEARRNALYDAIESTFDGRGLSLQGGRIFVSEGSFDAEAVENALVLLGARYQASTETI